MKEKMKRLVSALALTLVATSLPTIAWASGKASNGKAVHLFDSAAIPNNAAVTGATHRFKVHVQGSPLSQLSIEIPEGLQPAQGIEAIDGSGQKVPAEVSINNGKAILAFAQPIAPDTVLTIKMRGMVTPGSPQNWQYRVSGKQVGVTEEIPLGLAEISTFR
jgi:hypothetical protein